MSENTTEVAVGGVVLAVALGFMLYLSQSTGVLRAPSGGYDLTASFRSVEGITAGADVKLAGVKVGSITALKLNPKTYFADATIHMDSDVKVPTDSAILISQDGLLGGAYAQIVPGGSPDNLKPGGEIEDTQGAVSLIDLLMKFVSGSGSSGSGASTGTSSGASQ